MSNTFTHYLVPKEDGMLLGINKFRKVNLSEGNVQEWTKTLIAKIEGLKKESVDWCEDPKDCEKELINETYIAFEQAVDELLNLES